jgi:hypothetical protein
MRSSTTYTTADLIEALRRDGFAMLPGFFDDGAAAKAHAELEAWYARDLEERRQAGYTDPHFKGSTGHTVLTRPTHLMIDAYTKSPTLDAMFETALTDATAGAVLKALTGGRIKLRGYNVRRMTGAHNPYPAHEWHRDSLGEIGFGILLTDVEPEENGATAFIRGSTKFPYDPRAKAMLTSGYEGLAPLRWIAPCNHLLRNQVEKQATGGAGKRGDFYFCINDVWHGRQPNLHGRESMIVLIGAFPTEYPFPDDVRMPPEEIVRQLPPALATAVRHDQPGNDPQATILKEMVANRPAEERFSLFHLARLERAAADAISSRVRALRLAVSSDTRAAIGGHVGPATGALGRLMHRALAPLRLARRAYDSIAHRGWRAALGRLLRTEEAA